MWRGVFEILPYGRGYGAYVLDTYQMMWGILPNEVTSILMGQKSVDQGLKDIEERINQMIKELQEKW